MKLSEELLEAFDLEALTSKEPINIMKVSEVLEKLKFASDRIIKKSDLYIYNQDADIQLDCIDIVSSQLNDFVQIFKDLMLFIYSKQESSNGGKDSLRFCMNLYDLLGFAQTPDEKGFLRELTLRNELTHDYFNSELNRQKLETLMISYSHGSADIWRNLKDYCISNDYMDSIVDKGRIHKAVF